ncbi:hypothetical protein LJC22_04180 [Desulfosarcina sp. OttesenSCG-928-G10]|nr:hypothetical protein [Desulfosarcina sp. OttesenSCG-928-G10]MDL2321980.1 hypothetical protein [Desulfosarcina sp. OttesenSCG-928-B08]
MRRQTILKKIFAGSIALTTAMVVIKMIFLIIASLLGLFVKSEMLEGARVIIAMGVSVACGVQCCRTVYRYLEKEVRDL